MNKTRLLPLLFTFALLFLPLQAEVSADKAVLPPQSGVLPERDMESYPSSPAGSRSKSNAGFPSSYSAKTTSVKNQGANGLCWSFTALAVLESQLLKRGYPEYDFSEVHMAYALSTRGGNTYFGEDRAQTDGGNGLMAASYLMRGMPDGLCIGGAVFENSDPMTSYALQYGLPNRSLSVTASDKPKQVMPLNIYLLQGDKASDYDGNLILKVKDAVTAYGSVGAAYEYGVLEDNCYNSLTGAFYRNPYQQGYETDHLVQIIGWDDNYSRTNFCAGNEPPGNGAWKVKNSWGTSWGKSGIGWISYYDAWFPNHPFTMDGVLFYDGSKLDTYEYDYTVSESRTTPINGLYMRYYQARSDEAVTGITVFVESSDQIVEVDVLRDTDGIGSYRFQPKGRIKTHYPGWYTITLDSPQLVHKGKWFGAVIRTSASISIDTAFQGNSGYNLGSGWNYGTYGFCIKARTTKEADAVNICRAAEYLSTGNNLWNLIRGSNAFNLPSVVRENLSPPGNGPYGTKFQYVLSDTRYLHTDGSVTIPPCSKGERVTVPYTLKLTLGNMSLSLSTQLEIGAKPHNFGAFQIRTPATELAPGIRSRSCSVCGASETEAIPRLQPSLPSVVIKAPSAAKKACVVKWKKLSKANRRKVQYIEIACSRDRRFLSGTKSALVSSKKTSAKIKGLTSGKKYYVRIRAYTKSGSAVHISDWSAVKTFKVK